MRLGVIRVLLRTYWEFGGGIEPPQNRPGSIWKRFGAAWESSWSGLRASARRLMGGLEDPSSLDGASE